MPGWRRGAVALVALGTAMMLATSAIAQDERARIRDLNRQALEAYNNLELDQARSTLERALGIAERAQITSGPELAQTYVHLGIVMIAGFQDSGRGLDAFVHAIQADPSVQVDPALSSPEIQAKFQIARARAGSRPATSAASGGASSGAGTSGSASNGASTGGSASSGSAGAATTGRASTSAAASGSASSGAGETPAAEPAPAEAEAAAAEAAEETARGTHIVGDACLETAECSSGLVCDSGICTPDETEAAFASDGVPPRFFFHFGYSIGVGRVGTGMEASDTIPYDPRFKPADWNPQLNGQYAPPGYTEDQWANVIATRYASYVPGGDPGCDAAPDRYCVRITKAGFVPTGGMRVSMGYWIFPRIGLSTEWRFQTHANIGTMGRVMGSLRVHALITRPAEAGFALQAFVGGGIGQMQLRPSQGHYEGPNVTDPNTNVTYIYQGDAIRRPWASTGIGFVQAGAIVGYRFNEAFGVILQPTAYFFFPKTTIALDLTLAGQVTF